MNAAPSKFPQLADATRLSKPGFDILLAVSTARQSALPTVRLLRERSIREHHIARVNALRHFLAAAPSAREQMAVRPVRFLDLPDEANALSETMNDLFTRGFQSMLNPLHVAPWSSALPIPHDEDDME